MAAPGVRHRDLRQPKAHLFVDGVELRQVQKLLEIDEGLPPDSVNHREGSGYRDEARGTKPFALAGPRAAQSSPDCDTLAPLT